MAERIGYRDQEGFLIEFRWPGYPLHVFLVPEISWAKYSNEKTISPESLPFQVVEVHCGPPASHPVAPTADEWCAGVMEWLYR